MAFVSNTQKNEDQSEKDTKESFSDATSFVRRKFNKYLRRMDRRLRTNVPNKMYDIIPRSKSKDEDKPKGFKCFECEGFGHINIECLTFLRK